MNSTATKATVRHLSLMGTVRILKGPRVRLPSTQNECQGTFRCYRQTLIREGDVEYPTVAQTICVATYNMEAEDPMALTAYFIFDTINEFCRGTFGFNDDVHRKCQRVALAHFVSE